ncbi:MAG: hypothetical protein IJT16_01730 [Lachnospiraceae bacterium]|nr:hypothetical protein [Lachnospiraceae bacterium]
MIKKILMTLAAAACACFLAVVPVKAANVTVTFFTPYSVVPVTVPQGTDLTYKGPTDVNVPGYAFIGWSVPLANVQTDLAAIALYADIGTESQMVAAYNALINAPTGILSYTTVNKDTIPSATQNIKTTPTPVSNITTLTADQTFVMNPVGTPGKTCVVKWYNGSTGELLKTDIVPFGSSLPQPETPCIPGLEFVGWDGSWTNITSDRSITACFYKTRKLIFKDRKGNVLGDKTIRVTDSIESAAENFNKIDLDYKVDHWQIEYSSDELTVTLTALGNDDGDYLEHECEDCDGDCGNDPDDCDCKSDCRCHSWDKYYGIEY